LSGSIASIIGNIFTARFAISMEYMTIAINHKYFPDESWGQGSNYNKYLFSY
jgi:hypothetical protein